MVLRTLATVRPDTMRRLAEADVSLRARSGVAVRIGFVAAEPGAGCSTVAGLTLAACAPRRGRVLGVSLVSGPEMFGVTTPATTEKSEGKRSEATIAADVVGGLAQTPGGAYCLDLGSESTDTENWWSGLGSASRFFDVVATDWGYRPAADLPDVAASSTAVAVVASADRLGLQRAADLSSWFTEAGTPVVQVFVERSRRGATGVPAVLARATWPSVLLPYDRQISAGKTPNVAAVVVCLELAVLLTRAGEPR